MKIKDIMTGNVITVSSDTPIMEARKLMKTHKIRRLPVVDGGKLVGIITLDRIVGAGPTPASTMSIWEINYLLAKMTVRELMQKEVLTIGPEASIEQALVLAQARQVGMMPVLQDGKVIGVVTTTDFALKVLNVFLGLHSPGVKLQVTPCSQPADICTVLDVLKACGTKLVTQHYVPPSEGAPAGLAILVDVADGSQLISSIKAKGFSVSKVDM